MKPDNFAMPTRGVTNNKFGFSGVLPTTLAWFLRFLETTQLLTFQINSLSDTFLLNFPRTQSIVLNTSKNGCTFKIPNGQVQL